ncbi:MAG TPA: Rieske 2Fe-2S domain-containing protein [Bryobacteraceae bacterium]
MARLGSKASTPRDQESLWRDEFSVFQERERFVSRRQLIKFLTLTSLGMFAGNLWILVKSWLHRDESYPRVTIARAGDIPLGGVKLFRYPNANEQCLLIRTGENDYAAYSQKCTHLSCAVYYSREDNQLICPCHNGRFSVRDGAVIQGPPTRALPHVVLERAGNEIIAAGISGKLEG